MFYVGQRVVCVAEGRCAMAKVGSTYTVSGWTEHWGRNRDDSFSRGLLLKEIATPYGGFDPTRFRPIVERKTDISDLVRIAQEAARTGKVLA